ncbi:MAG TPA: PIG-L deacetylase family protein [Vicinamibacterales bacterium]
MMDPRLAGRSILAVFAHPDDESLACGGTLARLASEGFRVIVVSATHGERGGPIDTRRDDELGHERALEICEAAKALNISEVFIGDYPDGDLRWDHVAEFQAELITFIRRHRPAAVITFGDDGLYWHMDHVGVHERTTSAVRSLGNDAPPLYYVTMPTGVMTEIVATARRRGWVPPARGFWSLEPEAFGIAAQPATITVDVAEWVPCKLAAILCHRSQMIDGHPFAQLCDADARRLLGVEHFHRANFATVAEPVLERL